MFSEFDTEFRDSLKIFDGYNTSASLILSHSGETIPNPLVTSGSDVYVIFTSDGESSTRGRFFLQLTESGGNYDYFYQL